MDTATELYRAGQKLLADIDKRQRERIARKDEWRVEERLIRTDPDGVRIVESYRVRRR